MATTDKLNVSRRGFLKLAGAAGAAAALTGAGLPAPRMAEAATMSGPFENRFGVCDMCFNKCSFIARVKDGVVKKLDPNPKFLKSRGMLCARGNAGVQQLYDPDRLKYPLLRRGERGAGNWQRLTWDQALDHAAEKLQKIGEKYTRCGVAFMAGADMQSTFVHRFAKAFGSYNTLSHESLCLISGTRGFLDTFGEVPIPDMLYTKYVVMPGANRFESLVTPDSIDLMSSMKTGAKLVVLDPRYTKTAALADEWFAIKPHTDMAFILAIANVLISEELFDKEFVDRRCSGLDELRAHVKKYTPEWAAKETDVPAKDIRRIARDLAANAPASMIYPGRRSSDYEDSTQIRRAYAIVNALLGNWDRPGGLTAARKVGLKAGVHRPGRAVLREQPGRPHRRARGGQADVRGGGLLQDRPGRHHLAGKPYPVKRHGLLQDQSHAAPAANRAKTVAMFEQAWISVLDIDITMSDTAWMSDLVLPSQSYHGAGRTPARPCKAVIGLRLRGQARPGDRQTHVRGSKPVFWMMQGDRQAAWAWASTLISTVETEFRKAQLKPTCPRREEGPGQDDGVYYNPSKLYGIYEGQDLQDQVPEDRAVQRSATSRDWAWTPCRSSASPSSPP